MHKSSYAFTENPQGRRTQQPKGPQIKKPSESQNDDFTNEKSRRGAPSSED